MRHPEGMPSEPLPPPRDPDLPYRVVLVCLGNICRSPIAQVVLRTAVERAGLARQVGIDSSGTGDWHVGHPMDRRAAAALVGRGYDGSEHRAQQFTARWFDEHDLFLAMDQSNYRDVCALAPDPETARERVRLFRAFDPRAGEGDLEVPDPYYGGDEGFGQVLAIVERTAEQLAEELAELLAGPAPQ
jgi:protein-tyrosine phosphatase